MIRPPSSRTTVATLAFSLVALTALVCVALGFDGAALIIRHRNRRRQPGPCRGDLGHAPAIKCSAGQRVSKGGRTAKLIRADLGLRNAKAAA